MAPAIIGLTGVLIGALIVFLAVMVQLRYADRREMRRRELELKVKEIETLNLLNRKVNEVLQKRSALMGEYVSFDAFDDCYITIDDFVYLQSFTAQNSFYLPNYLIEEFFKNIALRKVVLSPEETVKLGGYAYKGGRVILETFSDQVAQIVKEKKNEMKKLTRQPLRYFDESRV